MSDSGPRHYDGLGYKPKYFLGDRVHGKWNGIPYTGTVAIDSLVDPSEGPYVLIFLDLPIALDSEVYGIIRALPKEVKRLKRLD